MAAERLPTVPARGVGSPDSDAPRVISTFSGCGGSSLGLTWAGFSVAAAVEFVPAAAAAYRANFPTTPVVTRDIRDISGRDLLAAADIPDGTLDVLEGSPPCSSFSMAGNRDKGWGKRKKYSDLTQRTDDLFLEWVRIAEQAKPRLLIAENVAGLAAGRASGYLRIVLAAIRDAGYSPRAGLLDAAFLGVPQYRKRLVIVGVREDLVRAGATFAYPKPRQGPLVTFQDVVPLPDAPRSSGPMLDPETGEDIAIFPRFAIGREWMKLQEGQSSSRYFQLVRARRDRPIGTLTATAGSLSAASITHPTEPRKLTVSEARSLCSFPPDFILKGTYQQQIERLGRAVPPLMYYEIGKAAKACLDSASVSP